MYNRDAVLPIDVKHKLSVTDNFDDNEPFDMEMFDAVLASVIDIRTEIHYHAEENIKKVQNKQKRNYDRRHLCSADDIHVGDAVLLKNNKCKDRKGGKFSFKWLGPYYDVKVTEKGLNHTNK